MFAMTLTAEYKRGCLQTSGNPLKISNVLKPSLHDICEDMPHTLTYNINGIPLS